MKQRVKDLIHNRRILFEFVSITFAVFLGLMMNQWKDMRNHHRLADQSESNILAEVRENQGQLEEMIRDHQNVLKQVDSVILLIDSTEEAGELMLNISFELLASTAWETAKLTQAIGYMEMNNVSEIAGVYNFQSYYESIVKDYILKNLTIRPKADDRDFLDRSKNFLESILPMEAGLDEYYRYLLDEILGEGS